MAKPVWIEILMKGNLNKGLDDARRKAESLDSVLRKVGATVGIAFGTAQATAFARKIMEVRGEVESLQISFETLAGKAPGKKLFGDIREFSVNTPMMMQDLAKGAQTLLGFNIEAEKVMPILRQIGDISMGDAQKFNSLVLAFAQMSSTGRLMGQDLLQMINAGFNPLVVIAEKTGRSMAELKKEMGEGKISVQMVEKAFASATAEGGKFHGMLEKQSRGIKGAISNLYGAVDDMLNDIGEKGQSTMVDALNLMRDLVKNYEKVLDILAQIVIAYGSYKAALMAIEAIHRAQTVARMISLYNQYRTALGSARAAQLAFNKAALLNPYVAIAAACTAASVAIYDMAKADNAAESAQKALDKTVADATKKAKDHQHELDELTRTATDEAASSDARGKALETLSRKYPTIFRRYVDEKGHLRDIISLKREIARLDGQEKSERLDADYNKAKRYLELYNKSLKGVNSLSKVEIEEFRQMTDEVWAQQSWWTRTKSGSRGKFVADYYKSMLPGLKTAAGRAHTENRVRELQDKMEDMTDKQLDEMATYTQRLLDRFTKKTKAVSDRYTNDFLTREDLADRLGVISSIKDRRHPQEETVVPAKTPGKSGLETETERKQKELDYQRQLDEYTKNVKRMNAQSELEVRQAQLDNQEDSVQKEMDQIQLNYDRLFYTNEQRRQQMVKELQEAERKQWEKDHPDATKRGLLFTATKTEKDLTAEQLDTLAAYERVAAEYKMAAEKRIYTNLLGQYQDYEAQRTEINRKFDADRRAIEESPLDVRIQQETIVELERRRKESIKAINDEETEHLQKTSDLMVRLFEDAGEKSDKEIRTILKDTKELLDYLAATSDEDIAPKLGFTAEQLRTLKASPDQVKAIYEQYKRLKDAATRSNPFKSLAEDIRRLLLSKDATGGKESSESKLKKLGSSAAETSDIIADASEKLAELFEAAGSEGMSQAMSDVGSLMGSVSNIGKGFAQGGVVGGIAAAAGEAIGYISKAFSAAARHEEALKAIMNQTMAQQREYNLLLMEQNLEYEKGTTIFGSDGYGKALNAVAVMRDAVADLNRELRGDGKYSGSHTFFGLDVLQKSKRELLNAYAGLADIEIKTDHKKTGLFGWGKGKDIYTSILKVYPEIIDANGRLNESLAETILSTREMSDEDKAALQNLVSLSKEAEKAIDETRSYLTGIFGELGGAITDALVDAFRNGTNAGQAFYDSVSGMLEKLGTEMIYSSTLQKWFDQAQQDMETVLQNTSLSTEEQFLRYTDILDRMTDGIVGEQKLYNELLSRFRDMAASKGFSLFASEKDTSKGQTAKAGAFNAMSQDQGTKLEGLFTSGLQHWSSMDDELKKSSDNIGRALDRLRKIEENTAHCNRLDDIAEDIRSLKTNGIKMR